MATPPLGRLLIVDDEDALAALQDGNCDLLLTDLKMPETDGIDLLRAAMNVDANLIGSRPPSRP